jgi:hypothetical protein
MSRPLPSHRVGGEWHAMPCHAMSCNAMACHVMSCNAMAWHARRHVSCTGLSACNLQLLDPEHRALSCSSASNECVASTGRRKPHQQFIMDTGLGFWHRQEQCAPDAVHMMLCRWGKHHRVQSMCCFTGRRAQFNPGSMLSHTFTAPLK